MRKSDLIIEFQKRFALPDVKWNKFLSEIEAGVPLKDICKTYNVKYDATRYLFYSLSMDLSSKSKRKSSVLELHKDLAKERGEGYDLVEELEKELEVVINSNRKLNKAITNVRDENNNLRRMSRVEDRAKSLEERVLEEFSAKISGIELKRLDITYKEFPIKPTQKYGTVVLLGDEHFGEVSEKEVCGNNYSHNIATKRLNYVIDTLAQYQNQSENLTVFELLDISKGQIHAGEYLSEEGLTGTMLKIVEVYADLYERISPLYKGIEVYVTNSNHDRTTQKPTSFMKWDNYGIMMMKMVDMLLKAKGVKNVNFNFTKNEYHLVEINGSNIMALHGDSIRSYKAYSKVERNHLQSICLGMFNKPYHIAVSGHTHQSMQVSNEYGGYNIVNGSLNGNSEYGITNGFSSIEPCQTIFFIDGKGKVKDLHFVNLSHIQN